MFFDFSKNRITLLLIFLLIVFTAVIASIYANKIWKIKSNGQIYAKQSIEEINYYWSHKFIGKLFNFNRSFSFYNSSSASYAKSVPVLVYHGLISEGDNVFSTDNFVDHMQALKDAGWHTVTIEQFRDFIREGKALPDKSFLLTFDDGRKDTFYPADPVLQDMGFTAVMFVITGFSMPDTPRPDSSYYLSINELQHLQDSGVWQLQSHGKEDHSWYYISEDGAEGHFMSNKIWLPSEKRLETTDEFRQRLAEDLSKSKKTIESVFGSQVIAYAFPFSDYGQDSINFKDSKGIIMDLVSQNYDLAFYQVGGGDGDTFNYPDILDSKKFMMKRIEPLNDWTGQKLLEVLEAGKYKSLPFVETDNFGDDWISSWGGLEKGSTLKLVSNKDTTGASVFLNGSGFWTDYKISTNLDWYKGSHLSVFVRFTDTNNYVSCVYGRGKVSIRRHKDGISNTVSTVNYTNEHFYSPDSSFGAVVRGGDVSCTINGESVLVGGIDDAELQNGGVGFQIWDQDVDNANIVIHKVDVEPL